MNTISEKERGREAERSGEAERSREKLRAGGGDKQRGAENLSLIHI